MALARDSRGHLRRKCKKRSNPLKIYRKDEFLARYRLSKKVVRQIVKRYKPHSTVKGKKNGGGLSHGNRVGTPPPYSPPPPLNVSVYAIIYLPFVP